MMRTLLLFDGLLPAQSGALLVACVLCLATNVLWYRLKFLLRARGYPISYIRHMQDLARLNALIARSPPDVERLCRIRIALYAMIVATLVAFVCMFAFVHRA
jgi:hypothetical protein